MGALDFGGAPAAVRPDALQDASASGAQGGALTAQGGPPAAGGAAPALAALAQAVQPPPAPTHGQTVAALRHFGAISKVLDGLLTSPEAGKSDMKSQIIDGVTSLVGQRIMSAATAVQQLSDVPDTPFKQRAWLQQHAAAIKQAEVAVLAHHGGAYGGTPEAMIDKRSNPDNHMDDVKALSAHYAPTVH